MDSQLVPPGHGKSVWLNRVLDVGFAKVLKHGFPVGTSRARSVWLSRVWNAGFA
jgi:hypothetical protein